jgi:hypothetical protein
MNSSKPAIDFYKSLEPQIQEKVAAIDALVEKSEVDLEGNCFYHGNTKLTDWRFTYKRVNYASIIRDFQVKRMLEIGFNAGHSSVVFLEAMPKDGEYISVDLGEHPYSRPCFEYLQTQYPQLKEYIVGDSRKTLPEFLTTHPENVESFDCIHVDGGHSVEVVLSDIQYSHSLLKPKGILIVDDTQIPEILQTIPLLLQTGYTFIHQIPTFGFSHVVLQKY